MAYPLSLSGLSTREQISDAIFRACLGLDSNNKALWESAWASDPEISMDIGGNVLTGLENMNKNCFDNIGPMDTEHLITSVRIDVQEGASVSHVTANALNQHFRKGQGNDANAEHLLTGSIYDIHVVKVNSGEWKLKTWAAKIIWRQGTSAVMRPA
jgi:SnoaL-like domain